MVCAACLGRQHDSEMVVSVFSPSANPRRLSRRLAAISGRAVNRGIRLRRFRAANLLDSVVRAPRSGQQRSAKSRPMLYREEADRITADLAQLDRFHSRSNDHHRTN